METVKTVEPIVKSPVLINFVGLYTIFFRKETNSLQSKNFRHNGNLSSARERAEKHCTLIGAKHMFTQPLISDLNKEEEYFLSKGHTSAIGGE